MNDREGRNAGQKRLTTQNLTYMAFAHKQSGTLIAAIELDLFNQLSQGAQTVPDLYPSVHIKAFKIL